jgi:hypothetical protein
MAGTCLTGRLMDGLVSLLALSKMMLDPLLSFLTLERTMG